MVVFAFGSAKLSSDDRAEIASLANAFRAARGVKVRVMAQTDGSPANLQMARRRAQAVKAEFVRRGVPLRSIEVETLKGSNAVIRGDDYARLVVMDVVSAPTC